MTSQSRNALGDAYLQATAAFDAACDIKELLDIWSTRQPLNVPPGAAAELRSVFRDAHRFLSQAEQKFEQVMSELAMAGGRVPPPPAPPSYRRRKLTARNGGAL